MVAYSFHFPLKIRHNSRLLWRIYSLMISTTIPFPFLFSLFPTIKKKLTTLDCSNLLWISHFFFLFFYDHHFPYPETRTPICANRVRRLRILIFCSYRSLFSSSFSFKVKGLNPFCFLKKKKIIVVFTVFWGASVVISCWYHSNVVVFFFFFFFFTNSFLWSSYHSCCSNWQFRKIGNLLL